MKVLQLSHFDTDGIISVINVFNFITDKSNFRYQGVGYSKIDKWLDIFINEGADILFITDLNLTQEQLLKTKSFNGKVVYIDHHEYNYNLKDFCKENNLNITVKYDKEYSGCLNTLNFLKTVKTNSDFSYLDELNELGNVYDLWKTDNPDFMNKALPLNDLFWNYGFDKFLSKFKNGYTLDDEDTKIINDISSERKEFLKNEFEHNTIINKELNTLFRYLPNDKYINDFTIYYNNFDIYLLNRNIKNEMVELSLRISNNINITTIELFEKIKSKFKFHITCGGHTKAGGIGIKEENFTEFYEIFLESIKELKGIE